MSEEKKSKKTKAKEFAYKAADKVGHFFRKALPYVATALVVAVVKAVTGGDDDNSTDA